MPQAANQFDWVDFYKEFSGKLLDYKNNKMYNNTPVVIERENGSKLEATSMRADIQTQESNYTDMHIIYYYDSDEKNANDDE